MNGSSEALPEGARKAALAGTFYERDAASLSARVDAYLSGARDYSGADAKALIIPHAGHVYSGPIAAHAYRAIARQASRIRRIVILCPNHRKPVRGVAVSSASHFHTPLGPMAVDKAAVARALALPFVHVDDEAHDAEHAIEVHLPFLQKIVPDAAIVPLVVGSCPPEQVDRLLAELWGGAETLIIVSSDLSHFHDYDTARRLDAAAGAAIERLRGDEIADHQACGHAAIRGLLSRARSLDLRATGLDIRSSGDTAGDRSRVVGYGSFAFEYARDASLSETWREGLKQVARDTVARAAEAGGQAPSLSFGKVDRPLLSRRATFVTLKQNGSLRGCVGSIDPAQPLVADVAANAYRAAFGDPRFRPVGADEARLLDVSVSILSTPRPINFASEEDLIGQLNPDRDGVILVETADGRQARGLFLPQVWAQLPDPRAFVTQLKRKAGLPADYWSASLKAFRFATESF